jgi:hypothetical protein
MGYHATSSGDTLRTFRDNVSVPPWRVNKSNPWDITQRRVVILNRRFETTHRSHPQGSICQIPGISRSVVSGQRIGQIFKGQEVKSKTFWPLKMGMTHCLETSVQDYDSMPCSIPGAHRSHEHRAGRLKSRILLPKRHTKPVQATRISLLTVSYMGKFQSVTCVVTLIDLKQPEKRMLCGRWLRFTCSPRVTLVAIKAI